MIERLRKKLSEQESLLLLMSPSMAFRVANRNGKVRRNAKLGGLTSPAPCWRQLGSTALASAYLLITVFQGYTFLISSDYERAEWRDIIREQQKKCEHLLV